MNVYILKLKNQKRKRGKKGGGAYGMRHVWVELMG